MKASPGKPWHRYRVGTRSTTPNCVEPSCRQLDEISHVAHVPAAIRILEDGRFRADLVYDKSKLNTERIRVVWLSPNSWAHGYRYGNVSFAFDWRVLIGAKRYYWVESIAYGVAACRILVTDADHSSTLSVYDPTAGDGPWWHDNGSDEHFWNGQYCLEVMYEGDIPLERATSLDFVDHHDKYCSIAPHTCRYCGWPSWKGGAEFVATIVSRGRRINVPGLLTESRKKTGLRPSSALDGAFSYILRKLDKCAIAAWGSVTGMDAAALSLARGILAAVARDDLDDLSHLVALFRSKQDAVSSVAAAVAAAIGLPEPQSLFE